MHATKSEMIMQVNYRMRSLGLSDDVIETFNKSGEQPIYCMDGSFPDTVLNNDKKWDFLREKVKQVEKDGKARVYAIIYIDAPFGKCYNLLYVSKWQEDWLIEFRRGVADTWSTIAYVYNTTDEWCSESGMIGVWNCNGILVRVA